MNDNSTDTELLIRYLDGELSSEETGRLETAIASNPSLQDALEDIRAVRKSLRRYGIRQQVSRVRLEMQQGRPSGRLVFLRSRPLQIAAMLILALAMTTLYWTSRLTPARLYKDNFEPITLTETRGAEDSLSLIQPYRRHDPAAVVARFSALAAPAPRDLLLAANAWLSLGQPKPAIKALLALQAENSRRNSHEFQDDAEYYLAMSYLADNRPSLAIPLFEKIHNSPNHLYRDKVDAWFLKKLHWMH
jgi:hypothetical protein